MIRIGPAAVLQAQRRAGSERRRSHAPLMRARSGGRDRVRAARHMFRPAASGAAPPRSACVELVDVGQHFGHRGVERRRNLVAELGMAYSARASGGDSQHRHAVFLGQFADALGEQVRALGHHRGARIAPSLVAQRHREVRRVGHHDVGLGHLRHHAAARHLALLARMRALICGSPSCSLASCRTSSLVMRSCLSSPRAGTARRSRR